MRGNRVGQSPALLRKKIETKKPYPHNIEENINIININLVDLYINN